MVAERALKERFEDCRENDLAQHGEFTKRLDAHAKELREVQAFINRIKGAWIASALIFGFLGAVIGGLAKPFVSRLIGGSP